MIFKILARDDVREVFVPDRSHEVREAANEAAKLRDRLDAAADAYAEGRLTARQLDRITERLRPQLETAEAKTRVVSGGDLLDGIVGVDDVAAVWAQLPLTRKRAIVDLLTTVTIEPTSKGRRFDPRHVRVEPKVTP